MTSAFLQGWERQYWRSISIIIILENYLEGFFLLTLKGFKCSLVLAGLVKGPRAGLKSPLFLLELATNIFAWNKRWTRKGPPLCPNNWHPSPPHFEKGSLTTVRYFRIFHLMLIFFRVYFGEVRFQELGEGKSHNQKCCVYYVLRKMILFIKHFHLTVSWPSKLCAKFAIF